MIKTSAILLLTTAIISGTAAYADGPGMNDPFFWIGTEAGAPEQTSLTKERSLIDRASVETPSTTINHDSNADHNAVVGKTDHNTVAAVVAGQATSATSSAPAIKGGMQREGFATDAPKASSGRYDKPDKVQAPEFARNPILDDYAPSEFKRGSGPSASNHTQSDDGCSYPKYAPATAEFAKPPVKAGERGLSPEQRRRGEMPGDDGVLSAIQDAPCIDIMRRGGETTNSASNHVRDGDIRRANTLEDRRIPTHSVGKYTPDGSGMWYRDVNNPYIDAAHEWRAPVGDTLSQLLHRWADDAGYTIVYQADVDYVIQADVKVRGTFEEAAGRVIEAFANATPPIYSEFYKDNKVIVIKSSNEFDGR